MIAFLEGELVRGGREAVVAVAAGAVGLDVMLSERGAARLPACGAVVRLWTHLAVREDAWTLYGFVDLEERAMFRLLLTVAGIGPRVALGMLSAADPAEIARCLRTGDERALARLPGIGRKSAARLVVELGQRVPPALAAAETAGAAVPDGALQDATLALQAMGVPAAQAEALLRQAARAQPELTDAAPAWVRAALARLSAPGR